MNHRLGIEKKSYSCEVLQLQFSPEITLQFFITDRNRVFKPLHAYSINQTSMKKVFIFNGLTNTSIAGKCQSSMINI